MSRKTKTFPLKELWEAKLNIKYNMEIEYYKKFCGVPYKYKTLRKNTDLYNDSEKTTYENWKCHIFKTIERLSLEELSEYSRFLNQENRNRETQLISLRSLLIPYAICIIGGGLISPVFSILIDISSDISGEPIGAIFISKIIILIIFAFFLFIPYKYLSD